MKKLTIEQKAQRYDEALEKAKQFHDGDLFAECNGNLVEYIFPELKESDDEKIRKEYFKYRGDVATVNVKHLAKHFFELGIKAAEKGE